MNWTMVGVFVGIAVQTIYLSNWLSSQITSLRVVIETAVKSIDRINLTLERHNDMFVRKDELQRQIAERNRELDAMRERISQLEERVK